MARYLHVPFPAVCNCSMGKIGGAYIGCAEARISLEDIGFCMKPSMLGVIGDLDFSSWQQSYLPYSLSLCSSHVCGADKTKLSTSGGKETQGITDH